MPMSCTLSVTDWLASTGSALASRHFMIRHCSAWQDYTAAMKPGMLWTIFGALASIDGILT